MHSSLKVSAQHLNQVEVILPFFSLSAVDLLLFLTQFGPSFNYRPRT